MYVNDSDDFLIKQFRKGNSKCFDQLLERYKQRVFSYIFQMVKDHDNTNDIFQEVFIKVINKLREGRYNEEGKFISWVMRISHNMVIDHFRKESKVKMIRPNDDYNIFNAISEESDSVESDVINKQVFNEVKDLVNYLSYEQREVVKMRYFSGMTFKEISEESGISINTALGRMRYALINLRKLKEKYNINLVLQ